MSAAVSNLIALVAAHPSWAYAAVFLAALLEAVPVAGSFVPGSTLIVGVGALVATGGLTLPGVLASAVAGAVIGDGSAYFAGRTAKHEILTTWPLSSYPKVIAYSESFFTKYGTLAVFFARFVAPVRAFVPVTAGALDMPAHRFFPINIAAILLWAPLHVLPGVLAGSAVQRLGTKEEHRLLAIVALGIVAALIVWAIWQCWRPKPVAAGAGGHS